MPAIQAEMVLIQAIAGDEWWSDVTLGMLENSRKRLRLLVKLIEKSKKKIVYTDFIDELGTETTFFFDFSISLTSPRSRLRAFSSMPSVTSFHQSSSAMAWISTNSAWTAGAAACSSSALAMARI